MDKDTAIKILAHLEAMFEQGNEVLRLVNSAGSSDVRERFQRILGMVVAEIDIELLEPIYKQFPDLRPPGMEEIKMPGRRS